jgi:hypothetical protein
MDAAIGHDLHAPVGEQKIDQHAGVVLGIPDAQPRKVLERALARRATRYQRGEWQAAFEHDAQFAPVALLLLADGALDR